MTELQVRQEVFAACQVLAGEGLVEACVKAVFLEQSARLQLAARSAGQPVVFWVFLAPYLVRGFTDSGPVDNQLVPYARSLGASEPTVAGALSGKSSSSGCHGWSPTCRRSEEGGLLG